MWTFARSVRRKKLSCCKDNKLVEYKLLGSSCHHKGEPQYQERHVCHDISWTFWSVWHVPGTSLGILANKSHFVLEHFGSSQAKESWPNCTWQLWICLDTRPTGKFRIGPSRMVPSCYDFAEPESLESSQIPNPSGTNQTPYTCSVSPLSQAWIALVLYTSSNHNYTLRPGWPTSWLLWLYLPSMFPFASNTQAKPLVFNSSCTYFIIHIVFFCVHVWLIHL